MNRALLTDLRAADLSVRLALKTALLFLVACTPEPEQPWRLDYDRVVAVRAEPPHIPSGAVARFDALIAHAGGPTTVEAPAFASALSPSLFDLVHFNIDHWEVVAPDPDRLVLARAELGLPYDAPVPLEVTLEFSNRLLASKLVYLGDSHVNPAAPGIAFDSPLPLGSDIALTLATEDVVRWLTSCGTLRDAETPNATLRIDEPCIGELAVVVRDQLGGTAWLVAPVRAE